MSNEKNFEREFNILAAPRRRPSPMKMGMGTPTLNVAQPDVEQIRVWLLGGGHVRGAAATEHARLFAEADAAKRANGLTPKQLFEQREALLKTLGNVDQVLRTALSQGNAWAADAYYKVHGAIADARQAEVAQAAGDDEQEEQRGVAR